MNFILAIQQFLVSLYKIAETISRVILLSKWNVRIPRATSGKPLAILANGPSLITDINQLTTNSCDLLCVNHFPTTELFQQLKPSYYVTAVPELWLEDVDPKYIAQRKALITAFSTVDWPITIFIPFAARSNQEWVSLTSINPNIELRHFNNIPVEGPDWFAFWGFKKNIGMPRPQNVLVPSLMIGLNMGYKHISLLGVDHSWLPEISVSQDNEVLLNQKHFYDEGISTRQPMDVKGKGKRNLSQVLHKFMHTFAGYYTIEKYSVSLGCRIVNKTKGSFIDAFARA